MRCDKDKKAVFNMICNLCKGSFEESTTTFFSDARDHIVVIKNVPCNKCTQCGNVCFDLAVTERLEHIMKQLENAHTEVAVVKYSAA